MSHIPNNAIPHAQANDAEQGGSTSIFTQFTDTIRENPKTAIAAGAAVAAGVAAATMYGRSRSNGRGGGGGKKAKKD